MATNELSTSGSGFTPTHKDDTVEAILTAITGKSRPDAITSGKCATCSTTGLNRESFRDELSRKEYCISGMCQSCQDSVFNSNEEEY